MGILTSFTGTLASGFAALAIAIAAAYTIWRTGRREGAIAAAADAATREAAKSVAATNAMVQTEAEKLKGISNAQNDTLGMSDTAVTNELRDKWTNP